MIPSLSKIKSNLYEQSNKTNLPIKSGITIALFILAGLGIIYYNFFNRKSEAKDKKNNETEPTEIVIKDPEKQISAGYDAFFGLASNSISRMYKQEELEDWKHLDGSPLIKAGRELCLDFRFYNKNEAFGENAPDLTYLLPAALFEGKKENNEITLLYQNKPIKLKICQKLIDNNRKLLFESAFGPMKKEALSRIEETSFTGSNELVRDSVINGPHEGYTLDYNGVLYRFNIEEKKLVKQENTHLRIWDQIDKPDHDERIISSCFRISVELPQGRCVTESFIDIVINDKFLSIASEAMSLKMGTTRGHIYTKNWQTLFPECTKQEVQKKIEAAEFLYDAGVFRITFPL